MPGRMCLEGFGGVAHVKAWNWKFGRWGLVGSRPMSAGCSGIQMWVIKLGIGRRGPSRGRPLPALGHRGLERGAANGVSGCVAYTSATCVLQQ